MYSSYHFGYKRPSAHFSGNSKRSAPPSPINSSTCSPKSQNTRNSFVALHLPHFFAVSPLLHYSYENMGGGGPSEIIPTGSLGLLEISIGRAARSCVAPPLRVARMFNVRASATLKGGATQTTSRLRAARPCLTPLESRSYENTGGYPMMSNFLGSSSQTSVAARDDRRREESQKQILRPLRRTWDDNRNVEAWGRERGASPRSRLWNGLAAATQGPYYEPIFGQSHQAGVSNRQAALPYPQNSWLF
jgi:hypothetical protein